MFSERLKWSNPPVNLSVPSASRRPVCESLRHKADDSAHFAPDSMTWKLCPPTVLVYIIVLCVVIVFCGPGPAQGYEDPGMSGRDLRIYNNGTLSFSVVYQNWTGYWTTQTTVAAGAVWPAPCLPVCSTHLPKLMPIITTD